MLGVDSVEVAGCVLTESGSGFTIAKRGRAAVRESQDCGSEIWEISVMARARRQSRSVPAYARSSASKHSTWSSIVRSLRESQAKTHAEDEAARRRRESGEVKVTPPRVYPGWFALLFGGSGLVALVLMIVFIILSSTAPTGSAAEQTYNSWGAATIGFMYVEIFVLLAIDGRSLLTLHQAAIPDGLTDEQARSRRLGMGCAMLCLPFIFLPLYLLSMIGQYFSGRERASLTRKVRAAEEQARLGYVPLTDETCQACGKPLQAEAEYCAYCGEPAHIKPRVCPKCATVTLADAKFCPKCGLSL